jgi:MFS family permease
MPVYVPSLLMSTSQMALLILLPLHIVELGLSPAFAAVVVGLRGVGLLAFDLPAGFLVARFGDKPVLLGGLGLILVGNVLLVASGHPAMLSLAAILIGAGFAAWMLGRQSYIADTCAGDEIGRAIAAMAGLQRVGIFIGPAAGGLVAATWGYEAAFAIAAVIAGVAGLFVHAFTANAAPASEESLGLAGMPGLVRAHARVLATAGSAALTLQLMRGARQLLVPLFGQAVGLDVAAIGAIYSISAGIDMCLFYPVGVIVDRHGRRWSAIPSTFLFAVGLALLPLAQGFYGLLAVSLVLGVANGLGTGIVMIIGADLARETPHRGQFLGLWRLIGDVGMSAAPLISGALVGVATLAAASLTVAGLGLAGTVILLCLVPETLQKRPLDVRGADHGSG